MSSYFLNCSKNVHVKDIVTDCKMSWDEQYTASPNDYQVYNFLNKGSYSTI